VTPEPAAPRLRLLGIAALADAHGPWLPLSRKDAALVARLALDGRQTRTQVASWLWPAAPLPRAHANLRQRLYRLRQASAALVEEAGEGLQLCASVAIDLDSADADFDAPLLASLAAEDDNVQDWLDDARRHWLARRVDRMSGLASRLEGAGALAPALALTERLLALEPLLEHGWRRLMRLHVLRGDRAAAVSAFERCERVLRDELGLAPSPETQALLARVESLAEAAPPRRPLLLLPPALLRPPRMVGRERERQAMAVAWHAGQAFLLLGEAGLGKSRLLAEFAAAAPGVLLVGALCGDEHVPYALLLRLLRRLAASGAALWPEGPARHELARLLPELGPAPAAPGLEALLQAALLSVFERAAAVGWAGVIVDDLQQADRASAAVLRAAAAAGSALRWGFGSRPDAQLPAWSRSSARVVELSLRPLNDSETSALIDTLGLDPAPDAALQARLLRHCGGNPLFLLETLKQLALDPATAGASQLPLPASVENAVGQRLEQLSAPALALLRVAALAGAEFHPEVAAEVLGRPLLALADPWREAESTQLLRPDGFAHEALRQTVLAGLPPPLRAPLHERIAFALQRRNAPAVAVARHFDAAGLWSAAGHAARVAAVEALRLGLGGDALARLADAVRFFTAAAEPAAAFEAHLAAVPVCLAQAGPDAALARADALRPLALDASQRVALARVRAEAALGGYHFALAAEAAAAALAEVVPGSRDALPARLVQAACQAMLGQAVPARPEMQSLHKRISALDDPLQAAVAWSHWALLQHATGQRSACIEALEAQRRHANAAGHAALEAEALGSLGGQLHDSGDAVAAIQAAGQAAALLRRLGDLQAARAADMNLVIALIGCDRLQDALQVLDANTPAGADIDGIAADLRAEAWLRAGQPAQALLALGDAPPAQASLARRLNHALLQAQAVQAGGDNERAAALWRALARQLPVVQSAGVALRAGALCSVVLPAADARARLDALLLCGQRSGVPAAEGLARLRRAACAWREGDRRTALADVHWLTAQRLRLRHLYLPQAELLALCLRILSEAGRARQAQALRQQVQPWFETELQPQLPAGSEAAWHAHPAWSGLLDHNALPAHRHRI
jgi:DNA-binding SARP family transcriptional activator